MQVCVLFVLLYILRSLQAFGFVTFPEDQSALFVIASPRCSKKAYIRAVWVL